MLVHTIEKDLEFYSYFEIKGISLHAFDLKTLRQEVFNVFKIDILTLLN